VGVTGGRAALLPDIGPNGGGAAFSMELP
jgi:hypothetical protein